jgi:hypothetical protein
MGTVGMQAQLAEASPQRWARIAGILYLLNIVGGAFAIGYVQALLVVPGDAAATARNLLTHESLYRLGLAAHLVPDLTNVALAVLFYDLFKVVNRRLASLLVFFILVGTAVESASLLNQFAPLSLLAGGYDAKVLSAQQVQALAYLPIDLQGISYSLSEVFFGCYALTIGYLVFRSTFIPRAVGALLITDGAAYLVYSLADILAPQFAAHLVPWIQLPILLGEGSLMLWLLLRGVQVERWMERANAAEVARSSSVGALA